MSLASPTRRQTRPRPPAPEPLETLPGLLTFLRIFRESPIAALTREHFESPIVVSRTAIGTLAVVSEPKAIRRVLLENAANYRRDRVQQKLMELPFGTSVLAAGGDQWRRQRRHIGPAFTPKRIAAYAQGTAAAANALMTRWSDLEAGSRLDIAREMDRAVVDVLAQTLFADGFPGDSDEILRKAGLHFDCVARISPLDLLGAPGWVPRFGRWRHRPILNYFAGMADAMAETRRRKSAGKRSSTRSDLVAVLLRPKKANAHNGLSEDEIKANIFTFFAAGFETSALGLAWALYLLSIDPEWRERIEAEADRELPDGHFVEGSLERLTATRAVVEETLRLYPPIPAINRQAIGADELAGEPMAPGTFVIVSPWVLHRHRLLWQEPDLFDPSRFEPGRREAIDRFAFLPFGVGPRTCIGGSYAMQTMTILLATIVRRYRLDLAPGHRVWPLHRVALVPQGGLPMMLNRRRAA